ncbi:hypothetical protein QE152_g13082 [Popillia japonica]|uniref:Uncharacterized protein n=1 Tax=Popillia japonica TaxID=7064 RepID=A0AAW1LEN6_POPJA
MFQVPRATARSTVTFAIPAARTNVVTRSPVAIRRRSRITKLGTEANLSSKADLFVALRTEKRKILRPKYAVTAKPITNTTYARTSKG